MSGRDDLRATLWLRYPDENEGPLWVAVHVDRRAGETRPVGVELWSVAPGNARADLGPEANPADDLLPWPAPALRGQDVRGLSLPSLLARLFVAGLPSGRPDRPLSATESRDKGGRPPSYGPEHWRAVAAVWHRADPRRRRRDVAEAFSVSMSTAKHWVDRCRRMALLD